MFGPNVCENCSVLLHIVMCLSFDVCALCVFNVCFIFNTPGIYGDLLSPFSYNGQKFRRNILTAAFIQSARGFWRLNGIKHALVLSPYGLPECSQHISLRMSISVLSWVIFVRHSFHWRYCGARCGCFVPNKYIHGIAWHRIVSHIHMSVVYFVFRISYNMFHLSGDRSISASRLCCY